MTRLLSNAPDDNPRTSVEFRDRRNAVPEEQRFVAFRRVTALTATGSNCQWTYEATGPSIDAAKAELDRIVREEGVSPID